MTVLVLGFGRGRNTTARIEMRAMPFADERDQGE
jgi:hypothetical protein